MNRFGTEVRACSDNLFDQCFSIVGDHRTALTFRSKFQYSFDNHKSIFFRIQRPLIPEEMSLSGNDGLNRIFHGSILSVFGNSGWQYLMACRTVCFLAGFHGGGEHSNPLPAFFFQPLYSGRRFVMIVPYNDRDHGTVIPIFPSRINLQQHR